LSRGARLVNAGPLHQLLGMTSALETIPIRTIDGEPATLGDYGSKVRLVVNVASKCGLTPQYEALEALYRKDRARGLSVLGFPANEFGAQEPGTEQEIKEFCSTQYDVTFPMFSKIVVKGPGQHPLYAALIAAQPQAGAQPGTDFRGKLRSYGIDVGGPSEISWNFEKFLVSRQGEVVARFAPDVTPDAPLLVAAIERELEKP
jgi:glutathione peroxidase